MGTKTCPIISPNANMTPRISHKLVVTADLGEQQHRQGQSEEPEGDVATRAQSRIDESTGQLGPGHHAESLGEGGEPRLEGAQAPGVLEIERYEIERAQERRRGQEHHAVGRSEQPALEETEVHQGSGHSKLHHHHGRQEQRRRETGPEHGREDQPMSGPSDMPYMSSPRPAPPRRNPGRSNRPASRGSDRSRHNRPKVTAAMPSGRLTKNTHRHEGP